MLSKFSRCQDICEHPELEEYKEVIFDNDSSKHSHYYHYSQKIHLNRSHPIVGNSFIKFNITENITSKFPFKYYGTSVSRYVILPHGYIEIFGQTTLGIIYNLIPGTFLPEYEVLDNNELLAVKWYLRINVDGTYLTATVTNMIHRNGKISFYYENIPTDPREDVMYSKIQGVIRCEKNVEAETVRAPEIIVSKEFIKSGTFVEFEPIERNCSENNSINECLNLTISNMKCIWCEKINMSINSNNEDSHKLNVTNFRVENMTSGLIEHNNTFHYLYIVIPIVVLFCVLCVGCIIWRWLYKRRKERQNVTISNVKCVWCEEDNMRINSNDKNSHESKVADHRIKYKNVDYSNTESFSNHNETILECTEIETDNVEVTNE